jgi:DNA primase
MRQTLQELKNKYRIEDVVQQALRGEELRGAGDVLTCKCPLHGGRHLSFCVYVSTQTWQCFSGKCEKGGDVFDFVGYQMYPDSWDSRNKSMFVAVLEALGGGRYAPRIHPAEPLEQPVERRRPIELDLPRQILLHVSASVYHTALLRDRRPSSAYAYFRDARNLTHACIREHVLGVAQGGALAQALAGLGLSIDDARAVSLYGETGSREWLDGRVVFCERDRVGRILHLMGRAFSPALGPGALKYLSLSEMTKPLYGFAALDKRESDRPVFIVEGAPDKLTLNMWGLDALANIGTKMKAHHAAQLALLRRPKVVVPNNDPGPTPAGLMAAQRWLDQIGDGHLLLLPPHLKDVNELAHETEARSRFLQLAREQGVSLNGSADATRTGTGGWRPRRGAPVSAAFWQNLQLEKKTQF